MHFLFEIDALIPAPPLQKLNPLCDTCRRRSRSVCLPFEKSRQIFKRNFLLLQLKVANNNYESNGDRLYKLGEVRTHEQLAPHQNVIKFHNAWEEKGKLYQLYELCHMNLEEFSERVEMTHDVLWDVCVDLLQGLKFVHQNNIVHLDIKPDNLFYGKDGLFKLGDFGISVDIEHVS